MIVNSSEMDIGTLLAAAPAPDIPDPESLSQAQLNDPDLRLVIEYLQEKKLPEDPEMARHVVLRSALFVIIDHILLYHDSKRGVHRVAVPRSSYAEGCWKRTIATYLEDTSQQTSCITLWSSTGGGMECTRTLCSLYRAVQNVLCPLAEVRRLYPLFTQYLCRDHFKLLVQTSWSYPRQHEVTGMCSYFRNTSPNGPWYTQCEIRLLVEFANCCVMRSSLSSEYQRPCYLIVELTYCRT